ncbi:MAG: hypothetical protein HYX90_07310 [Chloroflexi bacterium]|nr:hypothetical protein [Chloroflexota bacterium]
MAESSEKTKKIRVGEYEYNVGDSATCPECGRRFICKKHWYMNEQWYKVWKERGIGLGC